MVNWSRLGVFWKKKYDEIAAPPETSVALTSGVGLEGTRTMSRHATDQAREELRVLELERRILGSALTAIYDSVSKGEITEAERDKLLDKYRPELKVLEAKIQERQRILELFRLESVREELVKSFQNKLAEIESRVKNIQSGKIPQTEISFKKITEKDSSLTGETSQKAEHGSGAEVARTDTMHEQEDTKAEQEVSDAEKRIAQIRDEILKAMDRLEEIESEG